METTALRLYGKNDLRLESFELPEMKETEIIANVVTDSICMSSYKAVVQGKEHKRVPDNVAEQPTIIGHEMCGAILKIGKQYKDKFRKNTKYTIQPALNIPGKEFKAPGYSFPYIGGNATKIIIPAEVMEMNCLLPFEGEAFFLASLSEPVSCIIAAFREQYHTDKNTHQHIMGIRDGGKLAILGGAGPMGLGAIDYALNGPVKPGLLVITDVDELRLKRAQQLFPPGDAAKKGSRLEFLNASSDRINDDLLQLTGNTGFDDIFVFVPIPALIEQASRLLGKDGCLNFFAGPSDKNFTAPFNFYDIHYSGHHVIGSAGGNTTDIKDALDLIEKNIINPAMMITHIGGLDSAAETILNLPSILGGKILIYNQISLPLIALDDLEGLTKEDSFYMKLHEILEKSEGIWSAEAEKYLLINAPPLNIQGKG